MVAKITTTNFVFCFTSIFFQRPLHVDQRSPKEESKGIGGAFPITQPTVLIQSIKGIGKGKGNVSLTRKNFKNTVHQSMIKNKKMVQHRFSTVELGKENSKKMCLQPAPEGAKCL